MYRGFEILDAHVHYSHDIPEEKLIELMDKTGTDRANLLTIYHSRRLSCVPEALRIKARHPGHFFVYGGLDSSLYRPGNERLGEEMAEYAGRMLRCGCDGLKLLEGKPQLRKLLPIPDFDLPCWEKFWAYCEENAVPLLWHVNDPENFWDSEKVPSMAREKGWFYDGSYVNNEEQYTQVLNVLSRHPALKIIFAHFFFFSARLKRLSAIMRKYKNIMIDLTPGIELYENLSADRAGAQDFFREFRGRIIYGTDILGRNVLGGEYKPVNERENLRRPQIVRQYIMGEPGEIRSDGSFLIDREPFYMEPVDLSDEERREILGGSFLRFTGAEPRAPEPSLILEECARIRRLLELKAISSHNFLPDYSGIEAAEDCFSGRNQQTFT